LRAVVLGTAATAVSTMGVLVPPGHIDIHGTVSWDTREQLVTILHSLVADDLHLVTVARPSARVPGGLDMWCARGRPLGAPANWNDRALTVARHLGFVGRPFAGPVVFLGHGTAAGLHPDLLDWLDEALNRLYGGERGWPDLPG